MRSSRSQHCCPRVTVGPDYGRPPVETPAAYRFTRPQHRRLPTPAGGRASTIRCSRRWSTRRCATTSTYRSPQRASTHSSVRTSRREARCFRRSRSLPRFPSRRHDSAARDQHAPGGPRKRKHRVSTYQAGLTASWEIDLWGKVRTADRGRARRRLGERGIAPRHRTVGGGECGSRVRGAARSRSPAADRARDRAFALRFARAVPQALRRRRHLATRARTSDIGVRGGRRRHPELRSADREAGDRAVAAARP